MQVQLPIFFLCLLIHAGIYLTSDKFDRKGRLLSGIAILLLTWLVWYSGTFVAPDSHIILYSLGRILRNAPYYFPFFSFLVYIRKP